MLFIHAQLSSSAKQAVVICSIVATLLWCSGMIMCAIVCRNLHSGIFWMLKYHNFVSVWGCRPRIWDCLLDQTRTPLLKSLRTGLRVCWSLFIVFQVMIQFQLQNSITLKALFSHTHRTLVLLRSGANWPWLTCDYQYYLPSELLEL